MNLIRNPFGPSTIRAVSHFIFSVRFKFTLSINVSRFSMAVSLVLLISEILIKVYTSSIVSGKVQNYVEISDLYSSSDH